MHRSHGILSKGHGGNHYRVRVDHKRVNGIEIFLELTVDLPEWPFKIPNAPRAVFLECKPNQRIKTQNPFSVREHAVH
jgi:hypothetical protein